MMLEIGKQGKIEVGSVQVHTSSEQGLSAEYWVERCLNKIVNVAENSHSLIADQARAFKEDIRKALLYYMRQAIKSDRTTIYNALIQVGEREAAEIIRRM
jgi:hypothetical protein